MTPTELRAALVALVGPHLGVFSLPDGGTQPAIHVGNPPAAWRVTGLEINIVPYPQYDVRRVHAGVAFEREYHVRVIPRGGAGALVAERIMQRFDTGDPRVVPESGDIPLQYSLFVRS